MAGKKKKAKKASSKATKKAVKHVAEQIMHKKEVPPPKPAEPQMSADDLAYLQKLERELLTVRVQHSKFTELSKLHEAKASEALEIIAEKTKEIKEASNTLAKKYVGDKIEEWSLDIQTGKMTRNQ